MTVEIAVLNQQAIALAADSAVTVRAESGVKIYTSANKIFSLSKFWPVAIMVYGSAEVSGLPWETVIKVYRDQLGDRVFVHLEDQAAHFLAWLAATPMLGGAVEEHFVQSGAHGFLSAVRDSVLNVVREAFADMDVDVPLSAVAKVFRDEVKRIESEFVGQAVKRQLPPDFSEQLLSKYGTQVDSAIDAVFEELPVTPAVRRRLRHLAIAPFVRQLAQEDSGIVIAGFGKSDYLPCLRSYHVDGVVLGQAIYSDYVNADLSHRPDERAYVAAFAQPDFTRMFMEGVHPQYEAFVESYIDELVDRLGTAVRDSDSDQDLKDAVAEVQDDLKRRFRDELEQQRYAAYVAPVLAAVESLPKDELAALAESLVNLTVLKKRVSHDDETVGGPVDVAIISKGDGLIWARRKHYFDPVLNQHFFANYFRKVPDAETRDTEDRAI